MSSWRQNWSSLPFTLCPRPAAELNEITKSDDGIWQLLQVNGKSNVHAVFGNLFFSCSTFFPTHFPFLRLTFFYCHSL